MAKKDLLETQKKPGVSYALTDEGIELPVIDVTHDAFRLSLTDTDRDEMALAFVKEQEPLLQMRPFFRKMLLAAVLRGSILADAIRASRESYLSGLGTYLLKSAPTIWALPTRSRSTCALRIAPLLRGAPPSARRRALDLGRARAAARSETAGARENHRHRRWTGHRCMERRHFGSIGVVGSSRRHSHSRRRSSRTFLRKRALAALLAEHAPLHGLDISLEHQFYDWTEAKTLRDRIGDLDGIAIGLSEGGLFEYGADDIVLANLEALRDVTPADFKMAGSVTRNDETTKVLWRRAACRFIRAASTRFARSSLAPVGR